jgi:dUTP pyrophosphatase
MDSNDIKGYIEKLKQLEKDLSSGETEDLSFMDDLNELLGKLNTEFRERAYNSSNDLIIPIKRLHQNAVVPTYSKDGDAGMDLTIVDIKEANIESITYGFGVAMEIPKGYVGLIFPRSSVRNYQLLLSNCVGVIDSGYRGEIMATFKKIYHGKYFKQYEIGDRGAQIIVIPYPKTRFIEVDELSKTDRNVGGFGHTGK